MTFRSARVHACICSHVVSAIVLSSSVRRATAVMISSYSSLNSLHALDICFFNAVVVAGTFSQRDLEHSEYAASITQYQSLI